LFCLFNASKDRALEVVIDQVIFQLQSRGGISRIYKEILPRMCDLDQSLLITLLTISGEPRQPLPHHSRIARRRIPQASRYLRPQRLLGSAIPTAQRLLDKIWLGEGAGKIWHSTYYTVPERWKGKQIVTVADSIYERFAELFDSPGDELVRKQKRRSIMKADAVICISESTRADVQRFYGISPDKTYVIPLAHGEMFTSCAEVDHRNRLDSRPFLLYVGSRIHYKNFDCLLDAYSRWPASKEVDLIVVGDSDWSSEEEQRLIALNLKKRVHLLRHIDDQELRRLYNEAVAFVYPSLYEGFGIPLLEAMACGCPVVASRIPSTVEVAGDCPLYFDARSSDDLIGSLDAVLAEGREGQRQAMGLERARKYSWEETARRTLEVYRGL
jgi:glycosyltransferase involved in cell wall biosynthesis